ncbi:MAG: MBL fold metallo-hydrolase [Galbitalea sp.]
MLWHPDFGAVPRWASPDTVRIARSQRAELVAALGEGYGPETLALLGRLSPLPGLDLPWAGPEVGVVLHDAHIVGHSAAWLPDARVLIAGDMLIDIELPLPTIHPRPSRPTALAWKPSRPTRPPRFSSSRATDRRRPTGRPGLRPTAAISTTSREAGISRCAAGQSRQGRGARGESRPVLSSHDRRPRARGRG